MLLSCYSIESIFSPNGVGGMDLDDDPKNIPFSVGGSIGRHVVMGSNNFIEAPSTR